MTNYQEKFYRKINLIRYRKEKNDTIIFHTKNFKVWKYKGIFLFILLKEIEKHINKHIYSEEFLISDITNSISHTFSLNQEKVLNKIRKSFTILERIINSENDNYGEDRIYKVNYSTFSLQMPLYIILYLTYQCNLSCRHCLCDNLRNNNLLNPKTGIEVDIIRRIAQEMLLNGVFKIILTGGEPTFYKNFLKALEIFYNNKISISVITNGTLLKDDNLLKEIKKYDDGTLNFNVSLNGDDNGDGFLRGGNAYKETIRGLQNLIKYGYKDRITVKAVYYKHNLKNVDLFVKILYKIGIKDIKFIRLQPFGKGREIKELCPDINDIIYVNRKIIELGDKYPDISICGDIRATNKCAIPFSFAVLPNGDVIPCEVFELRLNEEVIMGNIKNTPIEKLWNSQKSKDIREKSKDFTKVEISCKRCNLFNYCLTNLCFAYNYIVFESRRTISKPCKFYEKFF